MPKLRTLRLSDNRIARLNVAPFHNVRTLYADNNRLGELLYASKLTKLENLSLRNQNGKLYVSFFFSFVWGGFFFGNVSC